MTYYDLHKNAQTACEGMTGSLTITDQNGPGICPKPCRLGVLTNIPIQLQPLRWHFSQHFEGSDSKPGAELLDLILKKESHDEEYANQLASSPPYFFGSPPVWVGNPLINDNRFGDEEHPPISGISSRLGLPSPSSASHNTGYARLNYGPKPAAVRVEGFDCRVARIPASPQFLKLLSSQSWNDLSPRDVPHIPASLFHRRGAKPQNELFQMRMLANRLSTNLFSSQG